MIIALIHVRGHIIKCPKIVGSFANRENTVKLMSFLIHINNTQLKNNRGAILKMIL